MKEKIISLEVLKQKISLWKKNNIKIVFTNGCFDILHLGHVTYLEKAKQLGHYLIVGVNDDDSVKRLKGVKRPYRTIQERTTLLTKLACVDQVVIFKEDTPEKLIQLISPNFLVKGGDYQLHQIVGSDWVKKQGGKVIVIPLVKGYSTTELVKKQYDDCFLKKLLK